MCLPCARPLKLRGHHVLCLLGFRGLGYSAEFVSNMQSVADRFFGPEGCLVELGTECDDVCSGCPHCRDGRCEAEPGAEDRVRRRDLAVLERLKLPPGSRGHSRELAELARRTIAPGELDAICMGCQWLHLGYCQEALKGSREAGTL